MKIKNVIPYLAGIGCLIIGIQLGKQIQMKKTKTFPEIDNKKEKSEDQMEERSYIKLR